MRIGVFAVLVALVLSAFAVYAFPAVRTTTSMAGSPCCSRVSVDVNMSPGHMRILMETNGTAVVRMPVALQHMHVRKIFGDGNTMRIVLDNNREINVMGPVRAVEHIQRMVREQFHVADVDMNRLAQRMQLTECRELNQQTLNEEYVPCYVAPVKVHARLLGIIPMTVDENVQCNAVSGDCTVARPWWAFLLFGARIQI